jgi:hypothetical protein
VGVNVFVCVLREDGERFAGRVPSLRRGPLPLPRTLAELRWLGKPRLQDPTLA